MNYTREELIQHEAVMNQMRNAIYHLARFMSNNGITEIKERLRRMGRNIARTYVNYWKPKDLITTINLKDFLTTIYQKIFNSSISLEVIEKENLLLIKDNKCPLCKYQYEDIEIAGCEIILGLISEFISLVNANSKNPTTVYLKPINVKESPSYGNKQCIQKFKYKIGRN